MTIAGYPASNSSACHLVELLPLLAAVRAWAVTLRIPGRHGQVVPGLLDPVLIDAPRRFGCGFDPLRQCCQASFA
jgi:hypothetical protein